jgi:aminoglycoside phosphotransferase (APT) family kinase protein
VTEGIAAEPGPLIAAGRSADIYEYGEGKVLRRRRRPGPIPAHEPAVMRAVRAAGYPAPQVFAVDGPDMVMERVVGVDMLKDLERHPWRARRFGAMLADLHVRLTAIPADPEVVEGGDVAVAYGDAEVYVHGDLHPANVILTAAGPVVIDWERARVGPADAEVASTWLLIEVGQPDDVPMPLRLIVGLIRWQLLRSFLARVPRPSRETVRAMCDSRLADPNMRPEELDRIRAFSARHG